MIPVGSFSQVFKGNAEKTLGGLYKKDILRIETGKSEVTGNTLYRYVSKARSVNGKKNPWIQSVRKAVKHLKIDESNGIVFPRKRGGTKEQRNLYNEARRIYENM
jgi:hypothetical protein